MRCTNPLLPMKTGRSEILLGVMQVLLPAVPGLYVILFRPDVDVLTPGQLIPWILSINLLFILLFWRRIGWSRRERRGTAALLLLFACLPWLEFHMLPLGDMAGRLWMQTGSYCLGQAVGYTAIVLAPGWVGNQRQRRYEERVLSGREKFESRREVMEQRAKAEEACKRK